MIVRLDQEPDPKRGAYDALDYDWANAFERSRRLPLAPWAEANRWLSGRVGVYKGPWRNDRSPNLVGIMDACSDPGVRTVTVMKSAQSGATEFAINLVFWRIDTRPCPILVVYPNEKAAISQNKDRMLPAIHETPIINDRLGTSREDYSKLQLNFDRCSVFFAGSNSEANLAMRAIGLLVLDEVDKYGDQASIEQAKQRVKTFRDHLILQISSPKDESPFIEAEYALGDRSEFWCPCPYCGSYQRLRFFPPGGDLAAGGCVSWDGGAAATADEARDTAHYLCIACQKRIADARKAWLILRGVWAPGGLRPAEKLPIRSPKKVKLAAAWDETKWTPKMEGESPQTDHRSFWIHGAESMFSTWGDLCYEFVRAGCNPTTRWINEALGETRSGESISSEADDLMRYAEIDSGSDGAYTLGKVPTGVEVLTCAIDVQIDHVYYEVVGWGSDESRWLIDYGTVACPTIAETGETIIDPSLERVSGLGEQLRRDNWALVSRLLDRTYPMASGEGSASIRWSFIDSRYRLFQVVSFCSRRTNIIAMRGAGTDARSVSLYEAKFEKGVEYLTIRGDIWKDEVFSRMHRRPPTPGAWRWPSDMDKAYALQMTSEELVRVVTKRGMRRVWRPKSGRTDQHLWDCARYNYAGAHYLGLMEIAASRGPKPPRLALSSGSTPSAR